VPSVLREDLPAREVPWGKQTKALLGGSTTLELSDAVSVSLTFRPLGITVLVHGQPAVTFNGRQMFAMEHLVEKKVRLQALVLLLRILAACFAAALLAAVEGRPTTYKHCELRRHVLPDFFQLLWADWWC
jgi:hypothetical protein